MRKLTWYTTINAKFVVLLWKYKKQNKKWNIGPVKFLVSMLINYNSVYVSTYIIITWQKISVKILWSPHNSWLKPISKVNTRGKKRQ